MTSGLFYRASLALISCGILSGCTVFTNSLATSEPHPGSKTIDKTAPKSDETPIADPVAAVGAVADDPAAASPQPDYFREAVNRAQSAVAIGQSAQSPDDWKLAESRWQQAILLMQQVPNSDPNYTTAQQKVPEYQKNATQASRAASGQGVSSARTAVAQPADGLVTQVAILNRAGGTPVVSVKVTGNSGAQAFPILFDTGANITLITPQMAQQVGVLIVDEIVVTVADGRSVRMPVGYVDTLQLGGLVVRDLLVGIGGDVALLGQDVYGEYGISVGGNSISLYR